MTMTMNESWHAHEPRGSSRSPWKMSRKFLYQQHVLSTGDKVQVVDRHDALVANNLHMPKSKYKPVSSRASAASSVTSQSSIGTDTSSYISRDGEVKEQRSENRNRSQENPPDEAGTGFKTFLRRQSLPMHRTISNENLPGIMRRARYSSPDLAAMAEESPSSNPSPYLDRAGGERRDPHPLDLKPVGSLTRSASSAQLRGLPNAKGQNGMRRNTSMNELSKGVNFSRNMEVFVFKA